MLASHPQQNCYLGCANTDHTLWREYFVELLARVFTVAQDETLTCIREGLLAAPEALRHLDHHVRAIIALFARHDADHHHAGSPRRLDYRLHLARTLVTSWGTDG